MKIDIELVRMTDHELEDYHEMLDVIIEAPDAPEHFKKIVADIATEIEVILNARYAVTKKEQEEDRNFYEN